MLEADTDAQTLTARPKRHRGVITYESFCESYWSHFPEPLIKGLGFYFSLCLHTGIETVFVQILPGIQ